MPTQKAVRRGQSNQYDTEVIIKWLIAREVGKFDLAEMDKEKLRVMKLQGDKLDLEVEQLKGNLIESEEVELFLASILLNFRAKILGIAPRLAVQLVGKKAPEIEGLLKACHHEALAELAKLPLYGDDNLPDADNLPRPEVKAKKHKAKRSTRKGA